MMVHPSSVTISPGMAVDPGLARHGKRKAVADAPEGNERLSKRLSLLNLDKSGARTYRAVRGPHDSLPAVAVPALSAVSPVSPVPQSNGLAASILPGGTATVLPQTTQNKPSLPSTTTTTTTTAAAADDDMLVDNTKYRVYIPSIDAELAEDEADGTAPDGEAAADGRAVPMRDDTGKLVFMPAVEKHLRAAARDAAFNHSFSQPPQPPKLAVPRPIVPNKDGEVAGMQVVLYRDPTSLTVAPEFDSVRQAILDTRARFRERRREEDERARMLMMEEAASVDDMSMTSTPVPGTPVAAAADADNASDVMDLD